MNELKKLLNNGVLGFYDRVEVTEIFACLPDKTIINVFTIIVAEDRDDEDIKISKLINNERIIVNKLKNWSFGIIQYTKTISEILIDLQELIELSIWSGSGAEQIIEEKLIYQSSKFVPPNSFEKVPLNKALKNNFWNGSHIIEIQNTSKKAVTPILNSPILLQELSEKINEYIPISLASLSDRLGNFVVQIPVTIIQARFSHSKKENDLILNTVFHPLAKTRKLRVNCEMEYDKTFNGYGSYEVTDNSFIIPMKSDVGPYKGIVWDDENNLILAATRPSSFIKTFSLGMGIVNNEPRFFNFNANGIEEKVRVSVRKIERSEIGKDNSTEENWTQKRLYKDEKASLTKQKRFVQYKPISGNEEEDHQKAISDIKSLISQYGEQGAWLWDPYLTANDVLKTLFHCPFSGSDLRALTNLSTFNDACDESIKAIGKTSQLEIQKSIFNNLESNLLGIKFEFRARIGVSGWNFHDRFIIFPDTSEGVLAWSLGTSVNSLGKQHHILQKIDDSQLIADSFIELWEQLDHQENLIWSNK